MNYKKFSKSTKKYIRQEKARIRREISDSKKQEELIKQLYKKFDKNISGKKEFIPPKKKTIAEKIKKTKTVKTAKTKKSISKKK